MKQTQEVIDPQDMTPATLYPDVHAQLEALAEDNENAVFDYEDPKGNKLARSHVFNLRGYKSAIEKRRKMLKADALEYGRKVDGAAKELTAKIEDMIAVHQVPLDAIEQREKDRKDAIQQAIDSITEPRLGLALPASSENIAAVMRLVEKVEITSSVYQERMAEATDLKADTLADLGKLHAQAVRIEAEAAELERLRAEAAERERKDREERIAREAAERAQREAEAKAQREREAAEAKARAEREEAEAERIAAEKRAADEKHREKVIGEAAKELDALMPTLSESLAVEVVRLIADGKIPHASIKF